MPFYDYRCETCAKPARLFFSFAAYESADPACPHCGEKTLKRRIRRVVIAKSEEKRMDGMMDESMLGALENEDPREIGRFMRKMSHEMGEDLGDEFGEVANRLEKGQSPEEIEQALPDFAASMGQDDGMGMGGMGGFDDF